MKKYAIGVDVGGTSVKMGLFMQDGNLLHKWEIPTRTEDKGAQILPDVAKSILSTLEEKNISNEDIEGVGVGVPGSVEEDGTVHHAVNLGWDVFNVPKVLGELLNLPIKAANDANVAAFGEMWQGGGKGYRNLVAVTLGTGVGGGIIVNGTILTGANGAGGEIGHLHMEDNEKEECGCKNKGCLEQYASATGIARIARRRLEMDQKPSMLRDTKITAKSVFDAVKEKDEVAIEVAKTFGEYLGKGLSRVAAVVNPEVFVIGGGVSYAGEVLFDYICPPFQKYVFSGCGDVSFVLAKLGNDAGIYGAAGLFLND